MSDYTTRAKPRAISSYVPAVEEILSPPPPPAESDIPVPPDNGGLGALFVLANIFVTFLLIAGMIINGEEVRTAMLIGAIYFIVSTSVVALIVTHALTTVIAVWQREKTERARIDAYADIAEMAIQWRLAIEKNRALELQAQAPQQPQLPAGGVQPPHKGRTFVPPYDKPDETAREAVDWAYSLYLPTGKPDPEKVQVEGDKRGWLLVRMLGSKRDGGSKEAGLWLLHRKFILPARGGYIVNLNHFPRREHLRALR